MAAPRRHVLQHLIVLALSVFFASRPAFDSSLEGSYVARTLNGHSLPADLRVPATAGDFRLFRLEQGILRLGKGGRFTLYFRYYHQLVRRGERPTSTPVMAESERGTYSINRDKIVLTPEKRRGSKSPAQIDATVAGEEIRTTYLLQNAGA